MVSEAHVTEDPPAGPVVAFPEPTCRPSSLLTACHGRLIEDKARDGRPYGGQTTLRPTFVTLSKNLLRAWLCTVASGPPFNRGPPGHPRCSGAYGHGAPRATWWSWATNPAQMR